MICQRCKEQPAKGESIYCPPCKLIMGRRVHDAFRHFCAKQKINPSEFVTRLEADICGVQPTSSRAQELAKQYLEEVRNECSKNSR